MAHGACSTCGCSREECECECDTEGVNCYEFSALLVVGSLKELTLVHGDPVLQRPPYVRYGHAWVEDGDVVVDPSGRCVPKKIYYEVGDIKNTARYTKKEASVEIALSGHYGPWDKKFDGLLYADEKKDA